MSEVRHRAVDMEFLSAWCSKTGRHETITKTFNKCEGCGAFMPQPGDSMLADEMAVMDTPLYREIQSHADDWLAERSDYGYGGELVEYKELDVHLVVEFVEKKMLEAFKAGFEARARIAGSGRSYHTDEDFQDAVRAHTHTSRDA